MPDDQKPPTEVKLSEAEVKRVLERAARIDSAQPPVSVSDLTQAAREAGISEQAVMQAVSELLEERQVMPATEPGASPTGQMQGRTRSRLRTVAFVLMLLIALLLILSAYLRVG